VDADVVLNEFCREALDWRYPEGSPDRAEAVNRLREELRLIQHHGLAGFFLVYRDLLQMAREVANEVRGAGTARGASGLPPGRGRGSSVSSIVCYLIGLSHVDPVTNNLFLGRFLNEEMHSVPDIDLDFARDIREQLILRVYEHYGKDHAALVCSFATYHIRSAVRDLGKVLGLPAPMLDKLAKLSEWGSAATVEQEMERLPEFKDLVHVPIWRHLIELAGQIASFPRHMSQHVGGMIISSRPIIELVPVQPAAMEGRYICQWDKDSCDDARFIKVDFLALGMLSLVEECLELIWQHHGKVEDLSRIDHNDPEIYDQICAGDTVGLFQIESRAQIQMLPRTQPRNLDDLAIEVAIVRPGPIVGGAVNPYVRQRERQRKGATDYEVDHPYLKEVLRDTLGVVLFQDQVMQVAKELAGFTDGQADGLRRAMSRRRSAEAMQGFREEFLNGAAMRGVDEATATKVFDKLVGFSEFGFPKSHAAAFAVLAFQSAWLRFHYPAEYLCALFNNQPMGFYAPHVLVGDGRRHGVQVLPVDINRSGVKCTVEYQVMSDESWVMSDSDGSAHDSSLITHHSSLAAVRLGLDRVRSLNEEVSAAIVAERERHGPFRDLEDFIGRIAECGLKRPAMENLILLGAFPSFELNRRELLWQYGLLEQTRREKRPSRNLPLGFGTEQDMIERPEMSAWERMVTDYHTLGLSPSLHPLGLMRARLPVDIVSAEGLESLPDGVNVRVAGLVVCRQRPGTAQGFTFLLIEDETGMANAIIRPPLYERKRPIVRGETMVIVRGKLQSRDGNINILVDDIEPLREPTLPTLESRERAGNDPREEAAREPVPAIPPARSFR
jgi:error-prone DNA polymerase